MSRRFSPLLSVLWLATALPLAGRSANAMNLDATPPLHAASPSPAPALPAELPGPEALRLDDRALAAACGFSAGELERARRYQQPRRLLYLLELLLPWALLLLLARAPMAARLAAVAERLAGGRAWLALLFAGAALLGALAALDFLLGQVRFWYERAWGEPQTLGRYLVDFGLTLLLQATFLAAALLVLHGLGRLWPRGWGLAGGLLGAALTVLLALVLPTLILPLFYRSHPVTEPEILSRVSVLADRAGLRVARVDWLEVATRTRKGNAYLLGLGPTKRVALFDTLDPHANPRYDPEQLELVLAHELGHWRHRHVFWRLLLGGLALVAVSALLPWLLGAAGRLGCFGLDGAAGAAAVPAARTLPLLALLVCSLQLLSLPLQGAFSRRQERQADRASLELTGKPEAFLRSQLSLARQNRDDLFPPRWLHFLVGTHPTTLERLRAALRWEAEQPAAPGPPAPRGPAASAEPPP